MEAKAANKNARIALKQLRMEIAAEYEMGFEDAFDIIENAYSNGVLSNHFKKLENKKNTHSNIIRHFE